MVLHKSLPISAPGAIRMNYVWIWRIIGPGCESAFELHKLTPFPVLSRKQSQPCAILRAVLRVEQQDLALLRCDVTLHLHTVVGSYRTSELVEHTHYPISGQHFSLYTLVDTKVV